MNDSNIMSASEMVTRVFRNIDPSQLSGANKVLNLWKEIVESIKSNSINGDNIGKNMASHSRVVDLENGILLVEADHPGWIQMITSYKKYIIRGFEMKAPELKIHSVVFRLAGSTAELAKIHSEIDERKERINTERKFEQDQSELDKRGFGYKSTEEKTGEKKVLPPELQKIFDDLENDILTH